MHKSLFQLCKESDGKTACVHPYKCLAQCKDSEFCNKDHICQVPYICKVDIDCKYGEECKENGLGRRSCQPPKIRPSISKTLIKDKCGCSKDCQVLHLDNPVCQEEDGTKICVKKEKCKCSSKETTDIIRNDDNGSREVYRCNCEISTMPLA